MVFFGLIWKVIIFKLSFSNYLIIKPKTMKVLVIHYKYDSMIRHSECIWVEWRMMKSLKKFYILNFKSPFCSVRFNYFHFYQSQQIHSLINCLLIFRQHWSMLVSMLLGVCNRNLISRAVIFFIPLSKHMPT